MQSLEWRGSGGETLEVEIKTVATASLALMRLGSFRVGPPRHLIRAHLSILPRTYLRSRTLLSSTQNMGFNCGQPLGRVQGPVRDSTCMSQSRYDGSAVHVVQSCLLHKGRLSIFIALDCRHSTWCRLGMLISSTSYNREQQKPLQYISQTLTWGLWMSQMHSTTDLASTFGRRILAISLLERDVRCFSQCHAQVCKCKWISIQGCRPGVTLYAHDSVNLETSHSGHANQPHYHSCCIQNPLRRNAHGNTDIPQG